MTKSVNDKYYVFTNRPHYTTMKFNTRKWVKPEDLNPNGTLFGGRLLAWIDEEAALYTVIQLENPKIVTKFMVEINFMASAKQGDIVEIGMEVIKFGRSSITMKCEARNKMTRETILTVDNMVMVNLGEDGTPTPHKKKQVEFVKDRLNNEK